MRVPGGGAWSLAAALVAACGSGHGPSPAPELDGVWCGHVEWDRNVSPLPTTAWRSSQTCWEVYGEGGDVVLYEFLQRPTALSGTVDDGRCEVRASATADDAAAVTSGACAFYTEDNNPDTRPGEERWTVTGGTLAKRGDAIEIRLTADVVGWANELVSYGGGAMRYDGMAGGGDVPGGGSGFPGCGFDGCWTGGGDGVLALGPERVCQPVLDGIDTSSLTWEISRGATLINLGGGPVPAFERFDGCELLVQSGPGADEWNYEIAMDGNRLDAFVKNARQVSDGSQVFTCEYQWTLELSRGSCE